MEESASFVEEEDDGYPDGHFDLALQFIVESGRSRPKGEAQRLIRSQARRKHPHSSSGFYRRPLMLHPKRKTDRTRNPSSPAFSASRGYNAPRTPSPTRGPAGGRTDPFNVLPIDEHGHSYYLLVQYHTAFTVINGLLSPVKAAFRKLKYLNYAITDPAVLHATLANVAKTLCTLSGTNSSPALVHHLGRSITLINQGIEESSHRGVTKETIMAVSCLTNLGLRSGDVTNIKLHLDGLEALVKSKGGMGALRNHALTLRFTSWVDTLCSIAMETKPRFDLADPNAPPYPDPQDLEPSSPLALRYETKLFNLTGLQDLAHETVEVYRMLRYVIAEEEIDRTAQKPRSPGAKQKFEWLHSYPDPLVHRFIALAQYQLPDSRSDDSAAIYKLFGDACLAHVIMLTHGPAWVYLPNLISSRTRIMSTRMRTVLEDTNCLHAFQVAYPEMILWIIVMGGLCSIGTTDHGWFTSLVAEACSAVGILGTAELAVSLKEFLWSDFYLDRCFDEFWNEVVELQAVEAG